jgi:hypothetical protein
MSGFVRVCRDCGEEYRPGVLVCADCGGTLEDRALDEQGRPVAPPEPQEPQTPTVPGRVLFLTPRAADLVPLVERLREESIPHALSEQPGASEAVPSRYALVVPEDVAESALRALGPLLAPPEEHGEMHAVESRFDAERGYLQCPACGTDAPAGASECPECGLVLAGEEPPQ